MKYLKADADFSDDRVYRFRLQRRWEYYKPCIAWILLNPSIADETEDDPTIRRCVGFSKFWGYGALAIYNLFALRSTNPKALYSHPNPEVTNDAWLAGIEKDCNIVCAWGNHGALRDRGRNVLSIIHENRFYLRKTKIGEPAHPLYLPASLPLIRL